MAELLVEFLSEEIPARMQARACADLKRLVTERLKAEQLSFERADAFTTPRRLALVVDGLPLAQPDQRIERKGPRIDAPDKAIAGFLGSVGLTRDACEVRETPKGTFLFAVIDRPGRPAAALLSEIVAEVAQAMPWPKSMRWANTRLRWVRPLYGVVAVFDGSALDGGIALAADDVLPFGGTTRGHRFLAPAAIEATGFADYAEKLRCAYVELDPAARRDRIGGDAAAAVEAAGLRLRPDEALLDEVTGLVEWPVVLMGRIDEAFMGLPPEVLTTAMRSQQKYFAIDDAAGALAPRFLFVANLMADDGGAAIVAGNERVLRARLADAKYFWDADRKTTLEERVPVLDGIVFHARLGSLGDKVMRLQILAGELADAIPRCHSDMARTAALLAKADLVTGMVCEFPELQGIMGRYYALDEGEKHDVADAIADHYSPAGPNDACPHKAVSIAVALADKIDTLVGFFGIGETPTGSKDPFALRRAALGVIRLILENELRVPLAKVLATSDGLYRKASSKGRGKTPAPKGRQKTAAPDGRQNTKDTAAAVLSFVADRLKVHLRDQGVPYDQVAAVFALADEDDLVRLLARVRALGAFVAAEDGANLLTAYRRATNIVRVEEKKDGVTFDGARYDPALPQPANGHEEADLWAKLSEVEAGAGPLIGDEQFADAMGLLARLRRPVDTFFDKVTVNVGETMIRENRLRLLARIVAVMDRVAVFSELEG